jgi:hypothetical protein
MVEQGRHRKQLTAAYVLVDSESEDERERVIHLLRTVRYTDFGESTVCRNLQRATAIPSNLEK